MTRYKITATRYDTNEEPISSQHSTVINTQWKEYKGATSEDEISRAFEKQFSVPQRNGSQIRVDNIERLVEKGRK